MQSREEAAREYLNSHKIRQVFQVGTEATFSLLLV